MNVSKKIFVGNINFSTTEDVLRDFFAQAGTIDDCFLPSDRETGRPRGFAFITYASEDEASGAIERFNGEELDGRSLRVDSAQERAPRDPGRGFGGPPPGADDMRFKKGGGSRRGLRGKKRSL